MKRKRTFARAAHGKAAESGTAVVIEVPPIDEQPVGVQAPHLGDAGEERRTDGTFIKGACRAQAAGGRAKKSRTVLSHRLGLADVMALDDFQPFLRAARVFAKVQCAELARSVGGGMCGPAPSACVTSASLALAASRYLYQAGGRSADADAFLKAARLATAARQDLLAAHSLCALEAEHREHDSFGLDQARLAFQAALASQPGQHRVNALPDVRATVDEPQSRQEPVTGHDGAITDEVPE